MTEDIVAKPDFIDAPPKEESEEEALDSDSELDDASEDEDVKPKLLPRKEMYYVSNSVEFLDRSWCTFSCFFALYYIL